MRPAIVALLLLMLESSGHAAYTEFYCDFANGDNLNSGSTTNAAATISYVSKVAALGWDSTTGIFTVASGNPASAGIPLNEWASVYVTAGATVATYIARITATNATTITVSLTAKSGTAPATDALGATTIRVGGVWKGSNGAVNFPFGFITLTATNASTVAQGLVTRVNFKATGTYAITAEITHSGTGPVCFQGMSAMGTAGDLGKATFDIATVGAGVQVFTTSGSDQAFVDLIFSNSGANSGTTTDGMTIAGPENNVIRCVVHDVQRTGFLASSAPTTFQECEAYACNKSNTSARGGFEIAAISGYFINCISHDNSGNANNGYVLTSPAVLINCIADTCGLAGYRVVTASGASLINCDAYNNTGDGLDITAASAMSIIIRNCNFIKNGGWGINSSGSSVRAGQIFNCGFGVGTQVNTLGDIATAAGAIGISGSVSYPTGLTPWVDPANGDFRINLPQAKAAGRGNFTETQASYTGTLAFPDIGAGQHRPAVLSYPFSH